MPDPLERTRNVGIIAHIDAGKTTTTERLLFYAGLEHRLGNVDDGTTVTDWMHEERDRGITITAADVTVPWRDHTINIIDTPGHVDFTAEVERALRVLDGAVVIFDAVAGVQAQSETVWRQADRYSIPRIAYINKMDRLGANFDHALESIVQRLGAAAIPIQLPLGEGPDFQGVVDLVTMTCRRHDPDSQGARYVDGPIPAEAQELAELRRDELVQALADHSDAVAEKYLDDEPIPPDELVAALRSATIGTRIVPVLCGSSLRNIGVQALADAVLALLPSPLDVPPIRGTHPKTGQAVERKPTAKGHPCALIFKVAADQHGFIFYLRVYAGTLTTRKPLLNPRTGDRERLTHLFRMHANERQPIAEASVGEIVAATGLKTAATGDTLCDPRHPIVLGAMAFPEPVVSMAIEPKTSAERRKLTDTLDRLAREDPTFQQHLDPETGQTLISGMGELHLEVLKHRMLSDFNLDANVGPPRVSYKETLKAAVGSQGTYEQETATRRQFAHVALRLEPIRSSRDIEVAFELSPADVPPVYHRAIRDGILSAASAGVLAGYPVVGVKATVTGGTAHPSDSTDAAFDAAATRAFRDGIEAAGVRLLEPWMRIEVITPEAHLGDVLGDLGTRRADLERTDPLAASASGDRAHLIAGKVPLSSMFGYASALRSLSQGRATFTMEPLEYLPVPDDLAEKFLL